MSVREQPALTGNKVAPTTSINDEVYDLWLSKSPRGRSASPRMYAGYCICTSAYIVGLLMQCS